MQTPGRPVSRPWVAAMKAAACSCRVRTSAMDEVRKDSTTSRFSSPGAPKMRSTPSLSSAATRRSEPLVISVSLHFGLDGQVDGQAWASRPLLAAVSMSVLPTERWHLAPLYKGHPFRCRYRLGSLRSGTGPAGFPEPRIDDDQRQDRSNEREPPEKVEPCFEAARDLSDPANHGGSHEAAEVSHRVDERDPACRGAARQEHRRQRPERRFCPVDADRGNSHNDNCQKRSRHEPGRDQSEAGESERREQRPATFLVFVRNVAEDENAERSDNIWDGCHQTCLHVGQAKALQYLR